jgi:hypothetical protein
MLKESGKQILETTSGNPSGRKKFLKQAMKTKVKGLK